MFAFSISVQRSATNNLNSELGLTLDHLLLVFLVKWVVQRSGPLVLNRLRDRAHVHSVEPLVAAMLALGSQAIDLGNSSVHFSSII